VIKTPVMPWSAWAAALILGISALTHLGHWDWLPWLIAALAVSMIGVGIRAFTTELHYREAQRLRNKGEDNDQDGPMDR
jgi:hypothetical protein